MQIAIAGAGMTGAYLYRLLDKKRHTVHIFDRDPGTACGIKPCAWGTSRGFAELVAASGLDPSRYILSRPGHVAIDGLKIGADLLTFDKRKLIGDLLTGAVVSHGRPAAGRYDRIIDATGVARAFLPPIPDDIVLKCVQYRIALDAPGENRIRLGRIGYGWSFPLSRGEHHIGCGSLILDPRRMMEEIGWAGGDQGKIRCTCAGAIRLTAPKRSQPFVAVLEGCEVWGVGEAVGCVAPLAGDGILPGMVCVRLLLEHWDDSAGYTKAVLKEFKWMEKERAVIDHLRDDGPLPLGDAWVLKRNAQRMGMKVGLKDAAALLGHLGSPQPHRNGTPASHG